MYEVRGGTGRYLCTSTGHKPQHKKDKLFIEEVIPSTTY